MSKTRWSILAYLGALSLMVGGLGACGEAGVAMPSTATSQSAQTDLEGAAAADDGEGVLDVSGCQEIPGTVNIDSQADLAEFASMECFTVERHLFVQETTDIADLDELSGLRSVGGYIGIADNTALTSVDLPNLVETGEGLVLEGNQALESISFDALRHVQGYLHVFNNQALTSASFDWLMAVGDDVIFAGVDALTSLELPQLTSIMGTFIFEHSDALTCLCLPNLVVVNGDFIVHFNGGLKSLTAPALTTVWGDVEIERNPELQVLDLSCLQWVAGDVTVIFNHILAQCSIDNTVAAIAHIGGDVDARDNQDMCPEVPVTTADVGCTDCTSNICAARDVDDGETCVDCDDETPDEEIDGDDGNDDFDDGDDVDDSNDDFDDGDDSGELSEDLGEEGPDGSRFITPERTENSDVRPIVN